MKSLKEFKPLIKFIKEDKFKIILSSIMILISGLTSIFGGYLNGVAVESITKSNIKLTLIALGLYFLIEFVIHTILLEHAKRSLYDVESKLTCKLGYSTYKKALDLPAEAYENFSSGEITNRITNDTNTLSYSFTRILNLISSIVSVIIITIYVFINSFIIGMYIFVLLGILLLILNKYNPKLKEIHKEEKIESDKVTSLVTESIRGIREIKTLGIKRSLLKEISNNIESLFSKTRRENKFKLNFNIVTYSLKLFIEVGTYLICIILMYYGKVSLTFFISMTYYVYRYMWLIENVNDVAQVYQKTVVSLGRVNEILENRLYEDSKFGKKELNNIKGIIEFKNVDFNYPNEENTLKDFNLLIEPNKKIAIVGKSGQGKTTLFNLLTRIFDPVKGSILIDGEDISSLTEKNLRENISIIRQEPFIFNKSIKENFLILDKNISLKDIRKYCKMAYIDDYIMSLPNKYDTIIGEGGVNLSGGQKQRLSIARTLCKKSKIILFDEATSALDNVSQEYIKKAIDKLVRDHTVVIVAHRLSTIIDADIIHVVDKGKVVCSGTHEYLLKNSDIYSELYNSNTNEE